jgi:DNA-binding transcriptional MerR regulator
MTAKTRPNEGVSMADTAKRLGCGELAKLAGLSPDSIRHYERIGILPTAPRSGSGYRLYGEEAVQRVRMVRSALQMGFSLRELADIVRARDRGEVPCHKVFHMAEEKLLSITQQIRDLRKMEQYMRRVLRKWRAELSVAGPQRHAMLLHSLQPRSAPGQHKGFHSAVRGHSGAFR